MVSAAEPASRTLHDDLQRLQQRAASATRGAEQTLEGAVRFDPYLAVAVALGVGFVLGGGLTRSVATLALGVGSRWAASWIGEELLARSDDGRERSASR